MGRDESMYHRRVDWIKPADMEILDILSLRTGLGMTSGNIAWNIGYTGEYVGDRCLVLTEKRLLRRHKDGYPFYTLTERGRKVIERNISPDELVEEEQQTELEDHAHREDHEEE